MMNDYKTRNFGRTLLTQTILLFAFVFLCTIPVTTHAVISDGANAIDALGQYDGTSVSAPVPSYTKGAAADGPNRVGFNNPTGSVIDTVNHRLFVSDGSNHRVLVYNLDVSNNLIDRVPDNVLGQPNFVSNTAAATQARMNNPQGLAYDSTNNRLFVAQIGAHRVTVYDVTAITDGENAINVLGQALFTTSTIATTQAGMSQPYGLAYDSTNNRLFVAQSTNNRVTVYDVTAITNGENAINVLGQADFTSSAAATTQAGMSQPRSLAYDSTNNRLFVAQIGAHRVTVYDVTAITNGENAINVLGQALFTTSASATTQAGMNQPYGLAYDSTNNRLFVAQFGNHRVTIYDVTAITDGENAINVLGQADFTSSAAATTQAGMNQPRSLAYDSTNNRLFVSQLGNHRVTVYDVAAITDGENAIDLLGQYDGTNLAAPVPIYTKGSSGVPHDSPNRVGFNNPYGSAIDTVNHRLFVADTSNHRVLVYNLDVSNNLIDRVPDNVLGQPNFVSNTAATTQAGMASPYGLAYDSTNNRLFVSESGNSRVTVYDVTAITDGENAINVLGQALFTTSASATTQAGMASPPALAYDSTNNRLFVAQTNQRVTVYDVTAITNGENAINVLGQALFTTSASATTQAGMNTPSGLAYDSTNNRLFVAESGNSRVTVYDVTAITDGENAINVLGQANFTSSAFATTQAGMSSPRGLAYDSTNNRLFVAESGNNRVTVYDVTAITNGENAINVLGQALFTTSASATTQAGMQAPQALAYDSTNNRLFVVDLNNHRVTIYDAAPPSSTISGNVYTDKGITPIANGKSIRLLVNGVSRAVTTTSGGTGAYSLTYSNPSTADIITVYIDNEIEDAVTVIVQPTVPTDHTGIDLYQDYIILGSTGSDFVNIHTSLETAHNGDTDITALYADSTTFTMVASKSLLVKNDLRATFVTTFDGNVEFTSDVSFQASDIQLTFKKDFINNGIYTDGLAEVAPLVFSGGITQQFNPGSAQFASPITVTASSTVSLVTNSIDSVGNLTIDTGSTLALNALGLTTTGTFSNDGTVRLNGSNTLTLTQDVDSGTWEYVGDGTGAATTHTIKEFGASDYNNLVINDTSASNSDTFQLGANFRARNSMTITDGTFDGQTFTILTPAVSIGASGSMTGTSGTMTVSGTTFSNAGTFTHNSGIVAITSDAITIDATAPITFYTLTKTETTDNTTNSQIIIDNGNISIANNLTLDGLDANDLIAITSADTPTVRTITFTGASTFTGDFLSITDNTAIDSSSALTTELNPANSIEGTASTTVGWFTKPPTVTNVTSSTGNSTYGVTGVISIQVTFSAAVTVTGTPQLTLETGTTDAVVNYVSGTGTDTLTFTYTVASGENSSDLDYFSTGALALNGGSIKSTYAIGSSYDPVNATLTLPTPGAAGSLGANKAIVVDTTADAATGIPNTTAGTDTGTFNNDDITSDTTPDFTISCVTGSTVELYIGGVASGVTGVCAGSTVTLTSTALTPDGIYSITAKQTDTASPTGNVSVASAALSITIDTTAPSAPAGTPNLDAGSDTGFSTTDDITSDTTPTFTGTGAGATQTIKVYDNGTLVCTTTSDGAGAWSCTTSALSEGTHNNITVREVDTAGNESGDSGVLTIIIDNTVPTGSFTTATFLNNTAGNQNIVFTIQDNAGGQGINAIAQITVTDSVMGVLTINSCTTLPSSGNTSVSCNVDISTAANAEETHVISVTVLDKAGKSATFGSPNYIIDRLAPTITSYVIDPLTLTPLDLTDPTITFSATDGVAVDHYELNVNGGGFATQTSPYAMTGASTSSLNTVILRAYDTAGNVREQTAKFYPIITISAPTVLSNTTITDTTINILIGAPGYLDSASASYNGGGSTALTCVPAIATNPTTTNCTLDDNITVTSSLTVDATGDPDGPGPGGSISGAQATQTYIIETVVPTITPTTPTIFDTATITDASFVVADANGIASVTFGGTSTNSFTCTPTPAMGSNVSSTTCTGTVSATGTLTVNATDRAGNSAVQYSGNFYIDATDPTLGTPTPVAGTYNTDPIVVTFSVTDTNSGLVPGDIAITGSNINTAVCIAGAGSTALLPTGETILDCTVTFNTGMSGSFQYTATDQAGNSDSSATYTYTQDLVDPTVTNVTSSTANGPYTVGAVIAIQVIFDETVFVTGTPTLTLATTPSNRTASYASGSGSTTLVFNYTVVATDTASDLDYVATNSLALSGGTIKDLATNDATLTLPAPLPAVSNSLGNNKNIEIDTTKDLQPGTPNLLPADDSGASDSDDLTNVLIQRYDLSCVTGSSVQLYADNSVTNVATGVSSICAGGAIQLTTGTLVGNPDTSYTITAVQTDPAGNASDASIAIGVYVNTIVPATLLIPDLDPVAEVGTDSGISATDNITNDTTPTFTGSCVTGNTITVYSGAFLVDTVTCSGSLYSSTPIVPFTDGVHLITVYQRDIVGNISLVSPALSVTIDTSAPASAPGTPDLSTGSDLGTYNSDNVTKDDTPTFTISCLGTNTVTLKEGATIYGTGTCAAGTVTITASPALTPDRTYNFFAYQSDTAGNNSTDSSTLPVILDTALATAPVTAPDLTTGSDTAGASTTDNITYDTTPTFTGSCTDDEVVKLYKDGVYVAPSYTCVASAYTFTPTITHGTYSITTTFTDLAGNESASASPVLSLTVDTINPAAPGNQTLIVQQ
jgi:uncharacterized protein YjiK